MKISFLAGKKTYLVALAMLITAFATALGDDGSIDRMSLLANVDWQMVLNAIGLGTLRAGIAKVGA